MTASLKSLVFAASAVSLLAIGNAMAGPTASLAAHSAIAAQNHALVDLAAARKGPRVQGYLERRGGGYSYNQADAINTYGDARTKYGSASVYRDPQLDKQSIAGPFDHGFFFDSAIGPHGGDAPYLN